MEHIPECLETRLRNLCLAHDTIFGVRVNNFQCENARMGTIVCYESHYTQDPPHEFLKFFP